MIELQNIRKVFNQGRPNEFVAIDEINLLINFHKATVLKGPSGSGKTTLLSLIGCMARPTSGRIKLLDREITSLPERFLTEIRRKTFGFIFQQFNLIRGISVLENVMLPALPSGENHSSLKGRALGRREGAPQAPDYLRERFHPGGIPHVSARWYGCCEAGGKKPRNPAAGLPRRAS